MSLGSDFVKMVMGATLTLIHEESVNSGLDPWTRGIGHSCVLDLCTRGLVVAVFLTLT